MERRLDSFEQAQVQLDNFVAFYNEQIQHQSLDMNTPTIKFIVAAPIPKNPSSLQALGPQGTWAARPIGGNSVISIAWQQISIG